MKRESGKAPTQADSALTKQVRLTPAKALTVPFDRAIQVLLPAPINPEKLVALFDGRATYAAIKSWRYGVASPPQWALDVLEAKTRERANAMLQPIKEVTPRRNYNGTLALAAWRVKQANQKTQ